MQKKLLAVAIAGAFGAPALALAQSSTVQIYGTIYMEYSYVDTPNSTTGVSGSPVAGPDYVNVDFLQTPGSNIGFKGEEKLGGGLSAWFQCETTADVRGLNQDGLCGRNSALGLRGGFGNIFIGVWDTPFKRTISPTNVGANDTGVWGSAALLTGQSTTVAPGGNRASFKRRQQASINYDSPNFGGFQVMVSTSTLNQATASLDTATNAKGRIGSLGAQYSAGPLYVSAAYERHWEFAGAGGPNDSKDSGWHVGAAYTWGPVRFGGQFTEQEFDTRVGAVNGEAKVKAWHVGVDWTIVGPHGLRAAFTQAKDMKGQAGAVIGNTTGAAGYRPAAGGDTGADMYQIRYVYTFSKRTEFNFGYVMLDNENRAGYRLTGLTGPIQGGGKEDAIAASIRHTF